MLRLVLLRLATLVPMVLGVTLLVFIVIEFSPNDPAYNALGDAATPQARAAFARANGLDKPLPVRYVKYVNGLLHGDLGTTTAPQEKVSKLVAHALPRTLQLAGLGLLIAVVLSFTFGVVAAMNRDRWPDQLIRVVSIAGIATPSFWLGILLIQQFALNRTWFPVGGYISPGESFSGWAKSMALPSLALALPVSASLTRIVRTSMVAELDRDYVRTAFGSGLPPRVVIGRNVLRNALITPLTVLGLRIGYLLGGAVIIETIFSLPGMGVLILNGVTIGDSALVQGAVLATALGFLLVNLLVDIAYMALNPRIQETS